MRSRPGEIGAQSWGVKRHCTAYPPRWASLHIHVASRRCNVKCGSGEEAMDAMRDAGARGGVAAGGRSTAPGGGAPRGPEAAASTASAGACRCAAR
eukprot:3421939-Prymnesium_polylepis.1